MKSPRKKSETGCMNREAHVRRLLSVVEVFRENAKVKFSCMT
jgi:hypothetical protein